MSEVLILHPAGKEAVAARLAEALTAAGYPADVEAIDELDGVSIVEPRAESGQAVLLIWSRALVSDAMFGGGLLRLRRLRNLIEISADGIEPPESGVDDGRVVLISGWRGQPFHPGWQILLERIRAQAGRKPAASPPETAEAAAAEAGVTARPARRGRLGMALGGAAILIAAAFGLALWSGVSLAPSLPSPPAPRAAKAIPAHQAAPAVTPAPNPPPAGQAVAALPSAAAPAASPPASRSAPPVPAAAPVERYDVEQEPKAVPAEHRVAKAAHQRPRPVRHEAKPRPRAPLKNYSPKYSKTMRLFCARAGRGTPECRIFVQSVRAVRRAHR